MNSADLFFAGKLVDKLVDKLSAKRRPSVGQAGLENSEIDRNRRDFVLTNPEIHHSSQDLGSSLALVTFSLVADKAIMEEP